MKKQQYLVTTINNTIQKSNYTSNHFNRNYWEIQTALLLTIQLSPDAERYCSP